MAHSIPDAKKAALDLATSVSYSVGAEAGLRAAPGALTAAMDVAQAVVPVDGSRTSPGNLPLDFRAPSAWHAACFLMAAYMLGRCTRTPFSDDHEIFESFFGNRPVYRGQARAWNIVPSGWRLADRADGQRKQILFELLASYMGREDAIEFDLFGRVRSQGAADALGQHYGMPTNLVDFTFDPMVALSFACAGTNANDPAGLDPALANNGVVYFLSFNKLCMSRAPTLTFPPVQAERLFRQAGFFIDYGLCPAEVPAILDYQESWMWVQQNCARVFFPRRYPDASELQDLDKVGRDLLRPEPFFAEAIATIKDLPDDELSQSTAATVDRLRQTLKTRPPWRVKHLDPSFIYTDNEFVRIASYVEYYVRVAGLVEMNRQPCLDPVILGKLGESDASGLLALKLIANMPGSAGRRLDWILGKIHESLRVLSGYMAGA